MKEIAKCPKCHKTNAKAVKFTWWGGALGPMMLNHVACKSCHATYNGKTGKANTIPIVIYIVIVCFILMIIFNATGLL